MYFFFPHPQVLVSAINLEKSSNRLIWTEDLEMGIPVKVNIESGGKMNGIPERR